MTDIEAIKARHAVRDYTTKPFSAKSIKEMEKEVELCNQKGPFHFQLVINDNGPFKSLLPFFARFKNVRNYIALVVKKQDKDYEACGYYGAYLMIKAQQAGLHTCFVTNSYHAKKCKISLASDEELVGVIAIGYGTND